MPFSVLNNRISTGPESTWTTSTIMELDPTLHTKSMVVQLQTLVVDAFGYLSPSPQHSYLVIIDGLDECHDKATQQSILQLLCDSITVHKLPLRFFNWESPRISYPRQF